MEHDEAERFIEAWGAMGVLWGINRSMARIHAFILLQDRPIDLESVAQRLNISKGNASMSLKELRSWGVIQRQNIPGDRRDFYVIEPNIWRMFFRILIERKRREFDPALGALRNLLAQDGTEYAASVHQRLSEMEELLTTANGLFNRFAKDEKTSKTMFKFFTTFMPGA